MINVMEHGLHFSIYRFQVFMIYEILFQNFRRWSLNIVDLFIFPNGFWLPGTVVQWYMVPTAYTHRESLTSGWSRLRKKYENFYDTFIEGRS